ncbi:hypothetical protein [Legionella maioricensis]|uniref:Uncharacterized protein n=1 Tax=Legionella maioricensis TaxID=2896528 RepID=A0A9X2D1G8_9GAMM|nr:hypothetical protein [Legionella maioricensis]MCL9684438.1 hypothetical protein [Legionella maioricensis]MCL9687619.1 hypothetical protein [Legionella maioricensis]
MTIEDLLISLTTYILRYHDSQPKNKPIIPPESNLDLLQEKYRDHALKTLKNADYESYLTGLIKEGEKDYAGRLPLLFYILNEITVIKSMVDRKTSFSPTELEKYKKQMTQMLIDLRQLVMTIKGTTYNVRYSSIIEDGKETPEKNISLSGTASYSYITGHSLCTSGSLLTEEVLKRFNITTTSSDKYIQGIAEELCEARQNALLVPELSLKTRELSQLAEQQKEQIELQQCTLKEQEPILQEQGSSIKLLIEKLEALTQSTKDVPASVPPEDHEALQLKLQQAQTKIEELEATIINLKKPLAVGLAYGTLFGLNNPKYANFRLGQKLQLDSAEDTAQKSSAPTQTTVE